VVVVVAVGRGQGGCVFFVCTDVERVVKFRSGDTKVDRKGQ